ncbi:MAG TPA: glycosyltransferase, partial [Acidimicrobiia bacterium]|nr:glycosyltransferase [Acidimicrobiia bacterium]
MTKVWITIPTLNEIENLDSLVQRVRAAVPDAHILIVDDGSADGTADKADALGAEKGGIEVLRRPRKMGLGSAYRAGHAIGIARGYDVMIQID